MTSPEEAATETRRFSLRVRSEVAGAPVRWQIDLDRLAARLGPTEGWIDPDSWQLTCGDTPLRWRADADTLDGRRHTLRFRAPAAGETEVQATCVVRTGPRQAPPEPPARAIPLIGAGEEVSLGSTAAVGDLHAGLQTAVDVVDWYGRGKLDLLLTYHGHEGGAYVYAAVPGSRNERSVYRRAGRLPGFGDDRLSNNSRLRTADFDGDGRFDLLECRGRRILWHRNTGAVGSPAFAAPVPLDAGGRPFDTGGTDIRVQSLCTVDLGDGRVSLIVGTNDWSDYWPKDVGAWSEQPGYRPYEVDGTWRGGPLRGRLFLFRNTADGAEPCFDAPIELCHEDGTPLEVYGLAGPARLPAHQPGAAFDLVVSDFLDRLWYFRNTGEAGADGAPRFTPRTPVRSTGEPVPAIDRTPGPPPAAPPDYPPVERLPDELVLPTCMHAVAVANWPSGSTDLLVGAEDGYVRALRLVRRTAEGVPVVGPPVRLQEYGAHLSVGAKCCPNVVDWDADGRDDLVIGNAAGQILLSRNVGTAENQIFAPPEPFIAGDRQLWLMAGVPGTVQGPSEMRWGYINPGVGTWPTSGGAGSTAIVCGDSIGNNTLYLGTSTTGEPRVSRGRRLHVMRDGLWVPLVTRWRCRPQLVNWGDGQIEYLQVDLDGKLGRFRILPEGPSAEDGEVRVELIDRLRYDDGTLVQLDSDFGGRIGRLKLAVTDWDGDGLPDVLMCGSSSQPVGQNTFRKSTPFLLRNVGRLGQPLLARPELVPIEAGQPALFGGHSAVPAPCFLNPDTPAAHETHRRTPDLLIGSENGRVYAYRRDYIEARAQIVGG